MGDSEITRRPKALAYPHMHIHDVDWLKGTLLLFEEVRRIVPTAQTPDDRPEIIPFTQEHGGRAPMLRPARIDTTRVRQAQADLARRLRERAVADPSFLTRFGEMAARTDPLRGEYGFQIHHGKFAPDLNSALIDLNLAWTPHNFEPVSYANEYVEVHRSICEAIMSVLAIACATGEQLDIVADDRAARLHDCLVSRKPSEVFDAWLGDPAKDGDADWAAGPRQLNGHDLFEFVLAFGFNTEKLGPEEIALLNKEREPIDKLLATLAVKSKEVRVTDNREETDNNIRDAVTDVITNWKSDQANVTNFLKKLLRGSADEGGGRLQALVSALIAGSAVAAPLAAPVAPVIAAFGATLAIGVVWRSGVRTYDESANSPYHYITKMHENGLVLRTDFGAATGRRK